MTGDACNELRAYREVVQAFRVKEDLQRADLSGSIQCGEALLQKLHSVLDLLGGFLEIQLDRLDAGV